MLQRDQLFMRLCKNSRGAVAVGAILVFLAELALAQSPASGDDDLLRFTKECAAATPDPFSAVAEIMREVDCVSALAKARRNNPQPVESPVLWITARTGPWEYRYGLDGAVQNSPACLVRSGLVLPIGRAVKVHLTSTDTIHQWAVPTLGIKATAIPGRIAVETLRSEGAGVVKGTIVRNEGSAKARSAPFTLRFLADAEYAAWESRALRSKGCGRGPNGQWRE
jgi:Cytochrome C oxidase subunit II, periplasmic domain